MAYVSQETKAKLAPTIKAICKKYGVKASIAVQHRMTLVLNIKQGEIDFIGNMNRVCKRNEHPAVDHIDVNTYWYHEHFDGVAKQFLAEVIPAMEGPDFFNNDDVQSDYFHRSHYIDINVGRWDTPYALAK